MPRAVIFSTPVCLVALMTLALSAMFTTSVAAQKRSTLRHHWTVTSPETSKAGDVVIRDVVGKHDGTVTGGKTRVEAAGPHAALVLDGNVSVTVSEHASELTLPTKALSLEAWVRIDVAQPWGGIVGFLQDNGASEKGVLLGIRHGHFAFGIATTGADDGDGKITYLQSKTSFVPGGWHHVVGTWDGKTQRLYVDGEPDVTSTEQSGSILYPDEGRLVLGAYHDRDERFPLRGRLHEVKLRRTALSARDVGRAYRAKANDFPAPSETVVKLITDEELAPSIDKGVRWLLKTQEPDGSWQGPDADIYRGFTALAIYTLIKCGLSTEHPAIQIGAAFIRRQKYERTYDLGVALMAMQALGEPLVPKSEIARLADKLVETCGNGSSARQARWGYPFSHSGTEALGYQDLSNTQYALLGLRAAHKAGVEVGDRAFWVRIARALIDDQGSYGGFGYRNASNPNSSMTTAGLTGLLVCRDILETHNERGLRHEVRGRINRGFDWLASHWSVTQVMTPNGPRPGWYYYYMYGLERVGAFDGRDKIGEHHWHTEGARELIRNQRDNGSWDNSETSTCFALLFCRRGSRVTVPPRTQAPDAKPKKELPFVIGANKANPLYASARSLSNELREQVSKNGGQIQLRWELDDVIVAEHDVDLRNLFLRKSYLEHEFKHNGRHRVRGLLSIPTAKGPAKIVESNIIEFEIDDVVERRHRRAITDHDANLVHGARAVATASSESPNFNGHVSPNASAAIDGRYATPWWCAQGDRRPWISIRLGRPQSASALKLAGAARTHSFVRTRFPRPKDIRVTLNGRRPQSYRLADDVMRKQVIRFPPQSVKTVKIEIVSVYPGEGDRTRTGFKEIELLAQVDHDATDDDSSRVRAVAEVVTRSGRKAAMWRYFTKAPGDASWTKPKAKLSRWRRGKGPFGGPETRRPATAWKEAALWMRTSFELPKTIGELLVDIRVHGKASVWINGIAAFDVDDTAGRDRSFRIVGEVAKALHTGKGNVIAIMATSPSKARRIDVGVLHREPTSASDEPRSR